MRLSVIAAEHPNIQETQHYIVFSSTAELSVPFPVCTAHRKLRLSLHKYRHKNSNTIYLFKCNATTDYQSTKFIGICLYIIHVLRWRERLLHFGALTTFAELVQSGSSSTDIHWPRMRVSSGQFQCIHTPQLFHPNKHTPETGRHGNSRKEHDWAAPCRQGRSVFEVCSQLQYLQARIHVRGVC